MKTNPTEGMKYTCRCRISVMGWVKFREHKAKCEDMKAYRTTLPQPKLYTEDEVRQAAKGGAANERAHWIRKLKGKIAHEKSYPQTPTTFAIIHVLEDLLSQVESDK